MNQVLVSPASHSSGAASVAVTARAPGPTPSTGRLLSLDTLRGFVMFWIVGGVELIEGLHTAFANRVTAALLYELNHTPWKGLRFYDCIWPTFMLLAGVSIPFSLAKRAGFETRGQIILRAARRALVLFLLGSLRESISMGSPYLLELSSALQPIAIAYFAAVLLAQTPRWVKFATAAGIWAGYALLLAFVGAPGIPAGTYGFNRNLVNYVDVRLLPEHWTHWRYASEGWGTILSTIPTVSTTILGLLVGELLLSPRTQAQKLRAMIALGLVCLAFGFALSPIVPIVMKMWTTSYGLASAGWACLMLAGFYWLIDVKSNNRWTLALAVFGANSIFIYMFSSIVPIGHWAAIFSQGLSGQSPRLEPLLRAVLILSVEWAMLYWMYRRKIFIRA
jgi:predicted acyltransferase